MLELHESPCLQGAGIALAVEGDPSLLAKHGPLPGRSYVILVRPCRRRRRGDGSGGGRGGEGGKEKERVHSWSSNGRDSVGDGVAAFDAGYYWHGLEETPAVEGVSTICLD